MGAAEKIKPHERIPLEDGNRIVIWHLKKGQVAEPDTECGAFTKTMVQATGEFAHARVLVEGQIVPGFFNYLCDYDSVPIEIEYPAIKSTEDRFTAIAPVIDGGSELTDVTVAIMLCR